MNWIRRLVSCAVFGVIAGLLPLSAYAAPLFTQDVLCLTVKCGTMEFDKYEEFSANSTFASKFWLGGVDVNGTFKADRAMTFHYLQGDRNDSGDFRWIKDATVELPQPFVDPPPGGYKPRADGTDNAYKGEDQKFDYLPWYDEGEFPAFADRPSGFFLSAKSQADKTLTNTFETWLVCVIQEEQGPNPEQAKDDSYKIAPLLGWQWGYDVVYKDVGTLGVDDFADFTVTKKPFTFVLAPTAHWTDALTAKYGAKGEDFWNITTGPCENCAVTPEPATMALLLLGLPLMALRSARRRARLNGAPVAPAGDDSPPS